MKSSARCKGCECVRCAMIFGFTHALPRLKFEDTQPQRRVLCELGSGFYFRTASDVDLNAMDFRCKSNSHQPRRRVPVAIVGAVEHVELDLTYPSTERAEHGVAPRRTILHVDECAMRAQAALRLPRSFVRTYRNRRASAIPIIQTKTVATEPPFLSSTPARLFTALSRRLHSNPRGTHHL